MFVDNKVKDIELELTTYCNADCPLCYRNYTSFKEHYPKTITRDLNDIIKQMNLYPDLEWVRLVGSISEPTLHPEFINICKYFKDRNIKIEICTNGDTRDLRFWKELSSVLDKEDKVYFTICGSTQKLHEKYRKGTVLFNILRNAREFRSLNKNDYAQCIRFDYNDRDFNSDEFKKMVSEFSNVYWTETFLLKNKDNYLNKEELDELRPFQEKSKQYEIIEKIADLKWKNNLSKERNCKAYNEGRLQIDINGNIYPCYLFLEASKGEKWDGDWEKILKSKYECCKFCDKDIVKMCSEKDLDYII